MASYILRSGKRCLNISKRLTSTLNKRYVSVASQATEKYLEGDKLHGYTVQKVESVPELSLAAILLTHDKTKARHLHVARDDSNNVFGVSFRTTPMDDTGVPHILEHTALCGSERYPVRDPFFKMLTRSLNTFMNAFTSSDWTMYPYSTRNPQDYRNLMSVYLDAAFFPRLRELDFMQEGWRLEHTDPQDPASPVIYKGVVYNDYINHLYTFIYYPRQEGWHLEHTDPQDPASPVIYKGVVYNDYINHLYTFIYYPRQEGWRLEHTDPQDPASPVIYKGVVYNDYINHLYTFIYYPRQEGWRLEHTDPQDPASPVIYKGVVYNEMKGVFSTAQNLFSQRCQNLLLPGHTYGTVYGGDPAAITDLTWQQLRDFHATHYHPSNARFYTYGDLPLEDHLQYISERALDQYDGAIDPHTEVPSEQRWTQPREEVMTCMPDPMAPDPNKQTTVAVSYLLGDVTDTFESFVLSLLGNLLVGTENSPFYKSLLESGIGADFSPVLGYDGNTRDASFSVGLQGIHGDDVDKVKAIVKDTFDEVIRDGFESDAIEALLHRIELSQKHQTDKFGLYMCLSVLPSWIHDGDPTTQLHVTDMVARFRQCLADDPQYLQNKVQQYFKDNPHRLTLTMSPEDTYEATRQRQEDDRLQRALGGLSETETRAIYDKGLDLLAEQMEESDLSCLPTLQVSDIPPKGEQTAVEHAECNGVRIQLCRQPTNAVTYFHAVSDLSSLEGALLPYVPLFCTIVTRMGAGDWDYRELAMETDLRTGGLSAGPSVIAHHSDLNTIEQGITFSSHCLNRNVDSMLDIWQQIFQRLDQSDESRLTTLILMTASELANSVAGSGHRYAVTHAASCLNPAARIGETLHGMSQVSLMKSIAESSDLSDVMSALSRIAGHVLSNSNVRCALNTTPDYMDTAHKSLENFVSNVISQDTSKSSQDNFFTKVSDFQPKNSLSHFELPFQVNYLGKSLPTVPYTHQDFASLRILSSLLSSKYLHREIREKGGAYGGGAMGNTPGQFSFYSYRDPNSDRTLDAFSGAVEWATQGNFSQQDIDESKLSVFAQVDAPVPPGSQGLREFLHHVPYSVYQGHREQLFDVSKDSLVNAANTYLSSKSREASISLLGPENTLSGDDKQWNIMRQ